MSYIVVWKDAQGQQISTVADARGEIVQRDPEYLEQNGIPLLDGDAVLSTLDHADGYKFAITVDDARDKLGWDV